MMNADISLQEQMITDFRENFFRKTGTMPVVLIEGKVMGAHKPISLDRLIEIINGYIPAIVRSSGSLVSGCKRRELADLRKIYYKIAHDMNYKATAIGRAVNKDHSTVLYGLDRFQDLFDTDIKFRELYNDIVSKIIEQQKNGSGTFQPAARGGHNPKPVQYSIPLQGKPQVSAA